MSVRKNLALAGELVFEAGAKLRTARLLARHADFAPACFYAQQAAENALKGVLIALDVPYARMHHLDQLLEAIPQTDRRALVPVRDRILELDKMYLPTRYPDALGGRAPSKVFTGREAKSAIGVAGQIVARAARILLRERSNERLAITRSARRPAVARKR